jgi:glycine cleavage system H protein
LGERFLSYQRAKFATRLPTDRLYTESHFWLSNAEDEEVRRVGFTRFATRMLGEVVEFEFEIGVGKPLEEGQIIGWFEGFKAITELYTPMAGVFQGANPGLDEGIGQIHSRPYDQGWLYSVDGKPPQGALDAAGYAAFLDSTIDRMTGRSS